MSSPNIRLTLLVPPASIKPLKLRHWMREQLAGFFASVQADEYGFAALLYTQELWNGIGKKRLHSDVEFMYGKFPIEGIWQEQVEPQLSDERMAQLQSQYEAYAEQFVHVSKARSRNESRGLVAGGEWTSFSGYTTLRDPGESPFDTPAPPACMIYKVPEQASDHDLYGADKGSWMITVPSEGGSYALHGPFKDDHSAFEYATVTFGIVRLNATPHLFER
jgi:hypothetical protein